MIKFLSKLTFLSLFVGVVPANAQAFLVYGSGESPDRMVVYTDMHISDRTPLDALWGVEQIKSIRIYIIFEAPDKPDHTEMNVEFACKAEDESAHVVSKSGKGVKPKELKKMPDVPARFRVASGFEHNRNISMPAIPASPWEPITSELFAQVRKIACNQFALQAVMQREASNEVFDAQRLRIALAPFGLQDMVYVGKSMIGAEYSDLTWAKLWTDGKRPVYKGTGRQLTAAEIAENEKKFAAIEVQAADIAKQASTFAQPKIDELDTQAAFAEQAAKIRGKRKVSKIESAAIQVWQGKREHDVALAMGPAGISDMDGLRFLIYTREFQRPVQTILVGPDGETAEAGGEYARCDVRFVLAYDQKGVPRVADVTMKLFQDDRAWGNHTCDDAIKAPVN